jgi:membrane-associated phospholipid phosphatase
MLAVMVQEINIALFKAINGMHTTFFDGVIGIVSGLGDGLVVALCCAVAALFRLRLGVAATLAFLLSGLVAQILKRVFDMPRPPAVLEHVHLLVAALQSHSFPSGHATSDGVMIFLAFLIWKCADWRAWLMAGMFLLAAYGRIYGGVHFPLDVIVGLLIGMGSMWLCYRWAYSWDIEAWKQSHWWWRIAGMIVLIEAGVLGLGYHMQPSTAQPLAAILPIMALVIVMQFFKREIHQGEGV